MPHDYRKQFIFQPVGGGREANLYVRVGQSKKCMGCNRGFENMPFLHM